MDFAHKSFSVLFLFFINENYDQDYQTIDAQLEHQFPLGRLSIQGWFPWRRKWRARWKVIKLHRFLLLFYCITYLAICLLTLEWCTNIFHIKEYVFIVVWNWCSFSIEAANGYLSIHRNKYMIVLNWISTWLVKFGLNVNM